MLACSFQFYLNFISVHHNFIIILCGVVWIKSKLHICVCVCVFVRVRLQPLGTCWLNKSVVDWICTVILTSVSARSHRLSHCGVTYVTAVLQLTALLKSTLRWVEQQTCHFLLHDLLIQSRFLSFLSSEPFSRPQLIRGSFWTPPLHRLHVIVHELRKRSVEKKPDSKVIYSKRKHKIALMFTLNMFISEGVLNQKTSDEQLSAMFQPLP